MFPDAKWLEAFKLPLKAILAITLSAAALIVLDGNGYLDFGTFQYLVRPILTVIVVVFGMLSIIKIIDPLFAPARERSRQKTLDIRNESRSARAKKRTDDQRAEIVKHLDHLSEEELRYVVEALEKGTPTFYTYVYSPPVTMLQGKMLVWTPGGQHHQDHYPYSFADFVWEILLERHDEFTSKYNDLKRVRELREKKEADQRRKRQNY